MKKILVTLSAIVIASFVIFFAVVGYNETQTQALINESKVLSASGKYNDALTTLIEAKNRDPSDSLKSEINEEIIKNEHLSRSKEYFDKGISSYDKGEYEEAIGYLRLVLQDDINYTPSQTYILLSESKLDENIKGSVAGVSTVSQVKVYITPTPVVVSKTENLEALCDADVSAFKSKASLQFQEMIRKSINEHQDIYSDPIWKASMNIRFADMKIQYDANINNVASQMKLWCLEHNRNYSGFNAPEVKYVF